MIQQYVLHLCAYAAPYGGNFISSLETLAVKLHDQGIETIFGFPEKAKKETWCQELSTKYKIIFLPLSKARINPKTYRVIRKLFREYHIIIAHSHFELYDIPLSLCCPKGVRQFWHLHDAIEMVYQNNGLIRKKLMRLQYGFFSRNATLLSASESGRAFAVSLGFNSNMAWHVPNGLDITRINKGQKSDIKKEYDFLMFGWDYYTKGIDILVDTLQNYNTRGSVCAVVCGKKTWEKYDLANCTPQNGKLVYQPPQTDVATLYAKTKCFLHISRAEGLSYALLEAIYAGCIVVCSDIPQNLFAKLCPTVHFIPSEDSKALSEMMEKIMNREYINTEEDIIQSRQFIEQHYSIENWVQVVYKYYFAQKG